MVSVDRVDFENVPGGPRDFEKASRVSNEVLSVAVGMMENDKASNAAIMSAGMMLILLGVKATEHSMISAAGCKAPEPKGITEEGVAILGGVCEALLQCAEKMSRGGQAQTLMELSDVMNRINADVTEITTRRRKAEGHEE